PALLRELDDAELLAATDLLDARDEQVDTPPVEQVRETLPRLDVDRDAQPGIALEQPAGDLPHPGVGGVGPHADGQLTGLQGGRLAEGPGHRLLAVEHLAGGVDDDGAEHGGRDRLAMPVEEPLAQLALDLEETLGQRGL